ncbi:MAG: UDP-N-acetylglucosamine--N-acetylmuramyl-(pentapeptide) pyrophosphoryl-undecaprenol N-acetylglucosamine transferase [Anaerolineaceae bacterium]|nr:UDP-N-acetylglucosamine--N-acetylmuramyl-(pentapeptide) pyrophosphoryl-undecaprenol N-acetylglucosamine transferase [Anaerolineaceae bacterium]
MAVLTALGNDANNVLWIGSEGGMESDLVRRAGIPFDSIPAAGVHGVGLRALPGNSWRLLQGTLASRRILRQFQPDVLLFTGGYVAVPMAVAGRGIPTLLYVPDIEPGLALKVLARFATCIGLTAENSRAYFKFSKRCVVTGYPTRPGLQAWDRQTARTHLNLLADQPVLLIFGGSKGARSLNRAVLAILPQLLEKVQVIHISGSLDWPEVETAWKNMPPEIASRYHPYPYLHEDMGAALASANLVVSRAGASTLGEFPQYGLPAVLVPYPYAWRYQHVNADYLVQNGAAVVIRDEQLTTDLLSAIQSLFDDPTRLESMSRAMRALAQLQAADKLAGLVRQLASGSHSTERGAE